MATAAARDVAPFSAARYHALGQRYTDLVQELDNVKTGVAQYAKTATMEFSKRRV